jgi:hypothetical protein
LGVGIPAAPPHAEGDRDHQQQGDQPQPTAAAAAGRVEFIPPPRVARQVRDIPVVKVIILAASEHGFSGGIKELL